LRWLYTLGIAVISNGVSVARLDPYFSELWLVNLLWRELSLIQFVHMYSSLQFCHHSIIEQLKYDVAAVTAAADADDVNDDDDDVSSTERY